MALESIFATVLRMSLTASLLIAAFLLLRILFHGKITWGNIIWSCIALRLTVPFSLKSVFSLVPADAVTNISLDPTTVSGNSTAVSQVRGTPTLAATDVALFGETHNISVMQLLAAIWLVGVIGMLLYIAVNCLRLRKKLAVSVKLEPGLYLCDTIDTPFIFGLLHPKIYLPSELTAEQIACILPHERMHLTHHDQWRKLIGFMVLSVHWFNPLCWLSYELFSRDLEMLCDNRVTKKYNTEEKKRYSHVLLQCSAPQRSRMPLPLAFGEIGVKERIRRILQNKKISMPVIILAAITAVAMLAVFMTDPQTEKTLSNTQFETEKTLFDPVVGKKADTSAPIYYISAHMQLYRKTDNSDRWKLLGRMESRALTKEELLTQMQMTPEGSVRDYTGGKITEAWAVRCDGLEYIFFTTGRGRVYRAVNSLSDENAPRLCNLTQMRASTDVPVNFTAADNLSFSEKKQLIDNTLSLACSRSVYTAYCLKEDDKNYAVVAFSAGEYDSDASDDAAGYAVYAVKNNQYRLLTYRIESFAPDSNPIFVFQSQYISALRQCFDIVVGLNPQLSRIERTVNGEKQAEIVFDTPTQVNAYCFVYGNESAADISLACLDKNGKPLPNTVMLQTVSDEPTTTPSAEQTQTWDTLDAAVSAAILRNNAGIYFPGVHAAEGHIIFGTAKNSDNTVTVYAYTAFSYYDFDNKTGRFVSCSGGRMPTVLLFEARDGSYTLLEYRRAQDKDSIRELFPLRYRKRAASPTEADLDRIEKQLDDSAQGYLDSVGSSAKIGTPAADFPYTTHAVIQ